MTNLFKDEKQKEFYFWVDPTNFMVFNNLYIAGQAFSNQIPPEESSPEENLLFIPNPKYKGSITPYHNNIAKRMRAEYMLEMYRPKHYPARTQALYLLNSVDDANKYKELHKGHVDKRLLIKGISNNHDIYSIHDSGWFDFLCMDASIDENTIKNCAHAYWQGATITQCELQLYGHPWSQPPSFEVLFYGNLEISEDSKQELYTRFKNAYQAEPWKYPTMHL